jgi:anti-anti-sigma regulatory factor
MNPFTLTRGPDGSAVLDLAGEITIEHVRELHGALCVSASPPRRLEVRCDQVTRLDAAAVQLLFAAARAAEHAHISGRGDAWTRAFTRYGLRDPFTESA